MDDRELQELQKYLGGIFKDNPNYMDYDEESFNTLIDELKEQDKFLNDVDSRLYNPLSEQIHKSVPELLKEYEQIKINEDKNLYGNQVIDIIDEDKKSTESNLSSLKERISNNLEIMVHNDTKNGKEKNEKLQELKDNIDSSEHILKVSKEKLYPEVNKYLARLIKDENLTYKQMDDVIKKTDEYFDKNFDEKKIKEIGKEEYLKLYNNKLYDDISSLNNNLIREKRIKLYESQSIADKMLNFIGRFGTELSAGLLSYLDTARRFYNDKFLNNKEDLLEDSFLSDWSDSVKEWGEKHFEIGTHPDSDNDIFSWNMVEKGVTSLSYSLPAMVIPALLLSNPYTALLGVAAVMLGGYQEVTDNIRQRYKQILPDLKQRYVTPELVNFLLNRKDLLLKKEEEYILKQALEENAVVMLGDIKYDANNDGKMQDLASLILKRQLNENALSVVAISSALNLSASFTFGATLGLKKISSTAVGKILKTGLSKTGSLLYKAPLIGGATKLLSKGITSSIGKKTFVNSFGNPAYTNLKDYVINLVKEGFMEAVEEGVQEAQIKSNEMKVEKNFQDNSWSEFGELLKSDYMKQVYIDAAVIGGAGHMMRTGSVDLYNQAKRKFKNYKENRKIRKVKEERDSDLENIFKLFPKMPLFKKEGDMLVTEDNNEVFTLKEDEGKEIFDFNPNSFFEAINPNYSDDISINKEKAPTGLTLIPKIIRDVITKYNILKTFNINSFATNNSRNISEKYLPSDKELDENREYDINYKNFIKENRKLLITTVQSLLDNLELATTMNSQRQSSIEDFFKPKKDYNEIVRDLSVQTYQNAVNTLLNQAEKKESKIRLNLDDQTNFNLKRQLARETREKRATREAKKRGYTDKYVKGYQSNYVDRYMDKESQLNYMSILNDIELYRGSNKRIQSVYDEAKDEAWNSWYELYTKYLDENKNNKEVLLEEKDILIRSGNNEFGQKKFIETINELLFNIEKGIENEDVFLHLLLDRSSTDKGFGIKPEFFYKKPFYRTTTPKDENVFLVPYKTEDGVPPTPPKTEDGVPPTPPKTEDGVPPTPPKTDDDTPPIITEDDSKNKSPLEELFYLIEQIKSKIDKGSNILKLINYYEKIYSQLKDEDVITAGNELRRSFKQLDNKTIKKNNKLLEVSEIYKGNLIDVLKNQNLLYYNKQKATASSIYEFNENIKTLFDIDDLLIIDKKDLSINNEIIDYIVDKNKIDEIKKYNEEEFNEEIKLLKAKDSDSTDALIFVLMNNFEFLTQEKYQNNLRDKALYNHFYSMLKLSGYTFEEFIAKVSKVKDKKYKKRIKDNYKLLYLIANDLINKGKIQDKLTEKDASEIYRKYLANDIPIQTKKEITDDTSNQEQITTPEDDDTFNLTIIKVLNKNGDFEHKILVDDKYKKELEKTLLFIEPKYDEEVDQKRKSLFKQKEYQNKIIDSFKKIYKGELELKKIFSKKAKEAYKEVIDRHNKDKKYIIKSSITKLFTNLILTKSNYYKITNNINIPIEFKDEFLYRNLIYNNKTVSIKDNLEEFIEKINSTDILNLEKFNNKDVIVEFKEGKLKLIHFDTNEKKQELILDKISINDDNIKRIKNHNNNFNDTRFELKLTTKHMSIGKRITYSKMFPNTKEDSKEFIFIPNNKNNKQLFTESEKKNHLYQIIKKGNDKYTLETLSGNRKLMENDNKFGKYFDEIIKNYKEGKYTETNEGLNPLKLFFNTKLSKEEVEKIEAPVVLLENDKYQIKIVGTEIYKYLNKKGLKNLYNKNYYLKDFLNNNIDEKIDDDVIKHIIESVSFYKDFYYLQNNTKLSKIDENLKGKEIGDVNYKEFLMSIMTTNTYMFKDNENNLVFQMPTEIRLKPIMEKRKIDEKTDKTKKTKKMDEEIEKPCTKIKAPLF